MIKKEPKLSINAVIGGLLVYLGYLLFLICIHITTLLTQNTETKAMLTTTFTVFLSFYVTLIVFGFAAVIIQFLRWLTYHATTPAWKKEQ